MNVFDYHTSGLCCHHNEVASVKLPARSAKHIYRVSTKMLHFTFCPLIPQFMNGCRRGLHDQKTENCGDMLVYLCVKR